MHFKKIGPKCIDPPVHSIDRFWFERDYKMLMLPMVAEVQCFSTEDTTPFEECDEYGFVQKKRLDGPPVFEVHDWATRALPNRPAVIAMLIDSDPTDKKCPARIFASPCLTTQAREFILKSYKESEILKAFRLRHGVRKIDIKFEKYCALDEENDEMNLD